MSKSTQIFYNGQPVSTGNPIPISLPNGIPASAVNNLTADQILVSNSLGGITTLGAGTSTTVIHGNSSGAPSYSAIIEADISLTDITTNNATSSKHGFLPKLSNVATQFLNGQGNFATPAGTTNSYLSTTFTSQTSVNVMHNFNVYPVVQILNNSGAVIIPLSITNNTANDFTVTFSASTTGTIIASVGSPQPNSVIVVAANYTILNTDKIVQSTASGVTITLPTAVGNTGRNYYINNASSGDITTNTTSSQTISGELTQILPPSSTMQVFSDGSNWWII